MKNRNPAAIVLVALLASACATPRLGPLPPGERISADVEPDRYGAQARLGLVNDNMGKGAGAGATAGAVIGVIGSLTCGPFFFICAPLLGGVATGAGALLGTAVGSGLGLPADTEEQLLARTRAYGDSMRTELVATVRRRVQERWTLVESPAPIRVRVSLDQVSLAVTGDTVALVLRSTVAFDRDGPRAGVEKRAYHHRSLPAHANAWTQDDGARIDEALRKAYAEVAEAIYLELAH
jgi:hypothetical protein